jgi:hypothetical protein
MAQFASDTFTGTEGTELGAYSSSWTKVTGITGNAELTDSGTRVRQTNTTTAAYYHSGTPSSNAYSVSCDCTKKGSVNDIAAGVIGRCSTSANTHYRATVSSALSGSNPRLQLFRFVSGAATQLGSNADLTDTSWASDATRKIELRMSSSHLIELYWNNGSSASISQTDGSPITAAGRPGVRFYSGVTVSDTTCIALDNFSADEESTYTHPTLSAVTSTEIGPTSFKPRVTYTF